MRVAIARIERRAVIDALRNAAGEGCVVKVVTNRDTNYKALKVPVNGQRVKVKIQGPRFTGTWIHSKYLLIKAASGKYIYTGSHNYTVGSMSLADETLLRLKNVGGLDSEGIYSKYAANFDALFGSDDGQPARVPDVGLDYSFQNPMSGKCADVASSGTEDGTPVG